MLTITTIHLFRCIVKYGGGGEIELPSMRMIEASLQGVAFTYVLGLKAQSEAKGFENKALCLAGRRALFQLQSRRLSALYLMPDGEDKECSRRRGIKLERGRMRSHSLRRMGRQSHVQHFCLHLGFQPFKELLELCPARINHVSCQN